MEKRLLLVTNGFPFGESERSFLEIEFNKLIQHFHVTVLAITDIEKEMLYPMDEAVQVHRININKKNTKHFFNILKKKEVWAEVKKGWQDGNGGNRIIRLRSILGYSIRAENYKYLIKEIVYRDNIDVVYTYWCTPATLAAVQLKQKKPGLKVITRIHGYDLYVERTGRAMWQPFRRYITDHVDRVVFVCEYAKGYYIDHWAKKCPEKCIVSYIGTKAYNKIPWAGTNELSLISCSNVIELKRIHLIVDALALVPEDYQVNWTHIGGGELLADIKRRAKEKLGKKTNIIYDFTGMIPNEEIEEIYHKKRAQLFITTSSTEGAPVSLEEAFAMGIPVIGTKVGGIPDLVVEEDKGRNGYLLTENPEPQEICETICNYINLFDEIKKNMKQNAYNRWKEVFDAEQNAEKFMAIIKGII